MTVRGIGHLLEVDSLWNDPNGLNSLTVLVAGSLYVINHINEPSESFKELSGRKKSPRSSVRLRATQVLTLASRKETAVASSPGCEPIFTMLVNPSAMKFLSGGPGTNVPIVTSSLFSTLSSQKQIPLRDVIYRPVRKSYKVRPAEVHSLSGPKSC